MKQRSVNAMVLFALSCALVACGGNSDPANIDNTLTSAATNSGRLQLSSQTYDANEANANAVITVARTEGSAGAISVRLTTRDGTAIQSQDYTAVDTVVSFTDGDSASKTIKIPILNDTKIEGDETVQITIASVTGGAALGPVDQAVLTIHDDDVAAPLAPRAAMSVGVKNLHVDWNTTPTATSYRLMVDATGKSGFTQLGADIAADATSVDIPISVHELDWVNARYLIAACNSGGCTNSNIVNPLGGIAVSPVAVGYFKASNAESFDHFGATVALSADGGTLAVGATGESSAATGVNGNQSYSCLTPATNCANYSGAVYVYTRDVDGLWVQSAYIKASNTQASASFGTSIALSADGTTLAVGATGESSAAIGVNGSQTYDCTLSVNCASSSGAVYVYTRPAGGQWSAPTYLKASNSQAYSSFGSSVALSADGGVLAVGGPGESSAATGVNGNQIYDCTMSINCAGGSGAVYAYTRAVGGAWSSAAYLKASNTQPFSTFGDSVALSADGSLLAVGATGESSAATGLNGNQTYNCKASINCADYSGAVYLFPRAANGTWSQLAYVKASNTQSYDYFGTSLALSADGGTMVAASTGESSAATGVNGNQINDCGSSTPINCAYSSGAAYLFNRSSGVWAQHDYFKASNTDRYDGFGTTVALSGDGTTLAIGAQYEASGAVGIDGDESDNNASSAGAVYAYSLVAGNWMQGAYTKASNTQSNISFGVSIALSNDGETLAVGATGESSPSTGVNGDQFSDCSTTHTVCSDAAGAVYLY